MHFIKSDINHWCVERDETSADKYHQEFHVHNDL